MANTVLDMSDVVRVLRSALKQAEALDQIVTDVDPDVARGKQMNNTEKAALSRKLLFLRDLIATAGSDCAMVYWGFKGHDDPRFTSSID